MDQRARNEPKRPRGRVRDVRDDLILDRLRAGLDTPTIARQATCSPAWVRFVAKRAGVPVTPTPPRRLVRDRQRKLAALAIAHPEMSVAALAAATGSKPSVVRWDLARLGLPKRPVNPQRWPAKQSRRDLMALDILADPNETAVSLAKRYNVHKNTAQADRKAILRGAG